MSAITMSPACISAGGRTSGSFGAPSVTVMAASIASPTRSDVSADRPEGRSIATTGMPEPLTSATTVSSMPWQRRLQAGAEERVDDQSAGRDLGEVQLPGLPVGDFDDGQRRGGRGSRGWCARRRGCRRPSRSRRPTRRRRAGAACARRRSRRRRCSRGRRAPRHGARRGPRRSPPSRPPPGARRSP